MALPARLAELQDSLAARAAAYGMTYTSMGIAVDVLKNEGLEHLMAVGDFHQVSAGGSWLNDAMITHIWNGYGAPSGTPQILVVRRSVLREESGGAVTYRVDTQQLVARKVGLHAIESWIRSGVPLPRIVVIQPGG